MESQAEKKAGESSQGRFLEKQWQGKVACRRIKRRAAVSALRQADANPRASEGDRKGFGSTVLLYAVVSMLAQGLPDDIDHGRAL